MCDTIKTLYFNLKIVYLIKTSYLNGPPKGGYQTGVHFCAASLKRGKESSNFEANA